ncbi:MAG: adenine deaminase, partial [Oscillospiraceae bacterium]|nr:adenine deaminase [Oscillospiraceae bacterium]
GMPAVEAIRSATIRNARRANLEGVGAVAPGYTADFLLVDELDSVKVAEVWYGGELVAKDGKMLSAIPYSSHPAEKINSMKVPELTADDLLLHCNVPDGEVAVTVLDFPGITEALSVATVEKLPVKNGVVQIEQDPELCYCAVINRHGSGSYTVGVVRGSGVMNGADASTVSHDSHNLTIVYRDAKAAHRCYELLRGCGGGLCYVNGEKETLLALPVGGVMTTERAARVRELCAEMRAAMHEAGMPQENPLLRITCFALPCIPDVKQTDRGLADTLTQQFIPLFPEG